MSDIYDECKRIGKHLSLYINTHSYLLHSYILTLHGCQIGAMMKSACTAGQICYNVPTYTEFYAIHPFTFPRSSPTWQPSLVNWRGYWRATVICMSPRTCSASCFSSCSWPPASWSMAWLRLVNCLYYRTFAIKQIDIYIFEWLLCCFLFPELDIGGGQLGSLGRHLVYTRVDIRGPHDIRALGKW